MLPLGMPNSLLVRIGGLIYGLSFETAFTAVSGVVSFDLSQMSFSGSLPVPPSENMPLPLAIAEFYHAKKIQVHKAGELSMPPLPTAAEVEADMKVIVVADNDPRSQPIQEEVTEWSLRVSTRQIICQSEVQFVSPVQVRWTIVAC